MDSVEKIRVVFLASGDLWAGAEVMVYQLVLGLFGMDDIDLLVILSNKGRLADELEHLGVNVQIVDESNCSFMKSIDMVRGMVKEFTPDVIHSHRYKENMLAFFVSRGLSGIQLVATQHGMPETVGNLSLTERLRTGFFFRLLSTGFTRTVLVSKEMYCSLAGCHGFSEKNVIVIHNGITVPNFVIARAGDRVIVGSAGRLFPVKDFSLLVDVARSVVEQEDAIDFVLAGDGPERAMLEERVDRYGLRERFRFMGHQEDMTVFYKGLGLYINTSIHEGIPMSVLEAMSHGVPVVLPKVGGLPEIVEDGVSGFLVESRDPEAFAQHILRLLDSGVRGKMGQAARERVITSFSREAMTQRYYQLYKELVGRG